MFEMLLLLFVLLVVFMFISVVKFSYKALHLISVCIICFMFFLPKVVLFSIMSLIRLCSFNLLFKGITFPSFGLDKMYEDMSDPFSRIVIPVLTISAITGVLFLVAPGIFIKPQLDSDIGQENVPDTETVSGQLSGEDIPEIFIEDEVEGESQNSGIHHVDPHYVEGYNRSDGTSVDGYYRGGEDGYYRSNPDGDEGNNLSNQDEDDGSFIDILIDPFD